MTVPVGKVTTIATQHPKIVYIKRVKEIAPDASHQLRHHFIKRVYFRATGQKSYSTVVAIEAKYDWQSRIANGAEVTDFNLDKMPSSEYMPLVC